MKITMFGSNLAVDQRVLACALLTCAISLDAYAVEVGDAAFYLVSTSVEHEVPYASRARIDVTGREKTADQDMLWWQLTVAARGGERFGVSVLSQYVPMTSPSGPGRIERYVYRDAQGRVLEYRDAATGKALPPAFKFAESLLPRAARDAAYDRGFASAGAFLGHVLTRVPRLVAPLEPVPFNEPTVLNLRGDLLIGPAALVRVPPESTAKTSDEAKYRPCDVTDLDAMLAAGMNLFLVTTPEQLEWALDKPVFFRTTPTFPDTFYRGNWLPGFGYLDEPMTRLGWSGGIPGSPSGPEQVAEALRQRVAAFFASDQCRLTLAGPADTGTLDLVVRDHVSWETEYWSAWYHLAGGAAGIVHEGRYVPRGYGWEPETLFGDEGLEDLTLRDQVNCLNAFLRGAARAFDADWGVSVYPESQTECRLPAMIQAYEMGARFIWFWGGFPELSFDEQRALVQGLSDHMAKHPRRDYRELTRSATVGIAFPPGCPFTWQGTWGVQREERSRGGASYGDIAAAGLWEGILCSRRGVPFDFLIDEPVIRNLGYDRLVIVRLDGSVDIEPPWSEPRPATDLALEWNDGLVPGVAARDDAQQDYTVRRVAGITIDGRLDDWHDAHWVSMDSQAHGFPDVTDAEATIINDADHVSWGRDFARFKGLLGMTFEQITPALEAKYVLEDLQGRGVVVTGVEAGSPAARAGILEGDVIVNTPGKRLDYMFQMFEWFGRFKGARDGDRIHLDLRRSGRYQFGGPGDLGAEVALAVDDDHLYVAARVTDDVHSQRFYGWDYWKGDCIQIGFDPTLERRSDGQYGEQDPEIGLIFQDHRAFACRWHGRRGQPLGRVETARVVAVRQEGQTVYEAAIPLAELAPMTPDLWPACGFDIVVNDNDGGLQRKGRLELRRPAMTLGKRTKGFATLRFAPSPTGEKISAAMLWRRRATREGGHFRAVLARRSPAGTGLRSQGDLNVLTAGDDVEAGVVAVLQSLDSPNTPPAMDRIAVPITPSAAEGSLKITTHSPPGRYRLTVRVETSHGRVCMADSLPVYIYPRGSQ